MNFDQVINRKGTYCTQWDYVYDRFGKADLLPFTISDTDFPLTELTIQLLKKRLDHGILGYTRWNHPDFKESVVSWFKQRFDSTIVSDWVVYSPSVMYSVSLLIRLLSQEGQGVIIQTPAYDAFYKTIRTNQRHVVENPLCYKEGRYSINFDHLESLMQDSQNRILLLCSPHNPTGRVWQREELQKIVDLCQQYQVFIISDEIHMDIVRPGRHHHPILDFKQTGVALLSSGSKTFNFAGLLFSYLMIPDQELRDQFLSLLKGADGLSSPSNLGMLATMDTYQHAGDWVDELNQYIEQNEQRTIGFIEQYCPKLSVVPAEATYLLWIDMSQLPCSMKDFQNLLVNQAKVAIMDGSVYGGNGADFLRLNIGCPWSKLQAGLNGLRLAYEIVEQQKP